MRYLQHANWHVREGALNLIAHCLISQSESMVQTNPSFVPQTPE